MKMTLLLVSCLLLNGCVSTAIQRSDKKLAFLSPGMDRAVVTEKIGPPDLIRQGAINEKGQNYVLAEYRLYHFQTPSYVALSVLTCGVGLFLYPWPPTEYWLEFLDDRLQKWGLANDWASEIDPGTRHRIKLQSD